MSIGKDTLIHAMAADDQVRCLAAVTTSLVGEACRRHRTFPTASVALGRTLTGGLLLGSSVKDLEKITVHFNCDGPIGNIIAQADAHGNVRGYVSNPSADVPTMNSHGKFDVRAVVGGGTMHVTRDAGFEIGLMKDAYSGSVPIVSGEIGEDFAYYLAKSEQINSAVSIGVLMTVDRDSEDPDRQGNEAEFSLDRLRVAAAGGFIVQVLPRAEDDVVAYLEGAMARAPQATEMVRAGMTPIEMLEHSLGEIGLSVLEEKEPRFYCQCSRERALLIISCLKRNDIQEMRAKDNGAELICHFCSEVYWITAAELQQMLDES